MTPSSEWPRSVYFERDLGGISFPGTDLHKIHTRDREMECCCALSCDKQACAQNATYCLEMIHRWLLEFQIAQDNRNKKLGRFVGVPESDESANPQIQSTVWGNLDKSGVTRALTSWDALFGNDGLVLLQDETFPGNSDMPK